VRPSVDTKSFVRPLVVRRVRATGKFSVAGSSYHFCGPRVSVSHYSPRSYRRFRLYFRRVPFIIVAEFARDVCMTTRVTTAGINIYPSYSVGVFGFFRRLRTNNPNDSNTVSTMFVLIH